MRQWDPNNPRHRSFSFASPLTAHHTQLTRGLTLEPPFSRRDKDDNGTLDKEEVKEALHAMCFKFIQDKQINTIFKKADQDNNGMIG